MHGSSGMTDRAAVPAPLFCPNPSCVFHNGPTASWKWVHAGFYSRQSAPTRIQRYQCDHCGRYFSEQTFRTTYWLKRPALLVEVFHGLVSCSCLRQIARKNHCSPQTVLLHGQRLGRHCLLFHQRLRPKGPLEEPLVLDGLQSFEYSQYHPSWFHIALGKGSHFFHGFTHSELRRSGTMTKKQRGRRAELEARFGRPDPRSIEREVARLLPIVAPEPQSLVLHTDEHPDYPRAIARLPHLDVDHRTVSSRAARTSKNPLFVINLADMFVRHSQAAHKRETVAFAKAVGSSLLRMWVYVVWKNYVKWVSEQRHEDTPAMRVGVATHRYSVKAILRRREFPSRTALPEPWREHYWGLVPSRQIPKARRHTLKYAA